MDLLRSLTLETALLIMCVHASFSSAEASDRNRCGGQREWCATHACDGIGQHHRRLMSPSEEPWMRDAPITDAGPDARGHHPIRRGSLSLRATWVALLLSSCIAVIACGGGAAPGTLPAATIAPSTGAPTVAADTSGPTGPAATPRPSTIGAWQVGEKRDPLTDKVTAGALIDAESGGSLVRLSLQER